MTEFKKRETRYWIGILSFFLLIFLDQLTKFLAVHHLKGSRAVSVIPGVFELYYLENRGAAFGIFANQQWIFIMIAMAMCAVAVYVYIFLPAQRRYHAMRICVILLASGAVGNMIDRIFHRYVVDFLYISLIDFPVFNVADCYVVIGAILLVLLLFTIYRNDRFECLNPRKE